jgi:hypothetical protein
VAEVQLSGRVASFEADMGAGIRCTAQRVSFLLVFESRQTGAEFLIE